MKFRLTMVAICCFLAASWTASAQKTVSGTVSDSNGEPMIGVNVVEEGTTNGAITDLDGSFSLQVAGDASVLVFSFVGYETQNVTVGTQTTFTITLQEDAEVLEEVVVSALGFKEKKDEMGSTYSAIKTEDALRSGEATVLNSLAGKAANVQIQRSNGDPGAGTTIRIRGANTISGSSDPLIILDGVPISNTTVYGGGNGGRDGGTSQQSRLNDINPNDIESIQILKGASAASLWGSRAANGVLIITTKSGKSGKPKISYKATMSLDEVNDRIDMQNTWGQGTNGKYSPTALESWGDYIPDRSGAADDVNTSGQYYEATDGTRYYPIVKRNSQETYDDANWDAVFQTGKFWQHDLSISGGGDKGTYFFSFGQLDQEGIIKESDYTRTNLRLNNQFFLADWLSVSSKAGYTYSSSNRIQQSSNTAGLLLGLLRTPPDFDNSDYLGTYYDNAGVPYTNRHRSYRRYLGNNVNPTYNNPLWTTNEQDALTTVNRFIMTSEINVIPTNWLNLTFRGGVDSYTDNRTYFFPIGSASYINGTLAEDAIRERELNFDAIAKANFKLSSEIGLTTTVGYNINDRERFYNSFSVVGFQVDSKKTTTDLNGANEASSVNNSKRYIRSNRGYGVLNFDMFDELFVNLSGSLEAASSVSGTYFYPSVDAAWQFTKTVVPTSPAFTFGKLRASWGRVGVQPQPHRFETTVESGFSYSTYSDPLNSGFFGGGFRNNNNKGNPDLEPEIKEEWEIGADIRMFRDKLAFGFTYYQNQINGILIDVDLPRSTGFSTIYANAGSMENKGFEFEADYTLLNKGNWDIGMYANWSTNENVVLDLQGTESIDLSTQSVSSRAIVGYPLGTLYGTGSKTLPDGSFDLNEFGFPQLTERPVPLGDPNPDWKAGLGMRINYKKLALNVLFDHSQGGAFAPRTLWVLRRFGTTEETAARVTTAEDLYNYAGKLIPSGTTLRGSVTDFGGGNVLLDESWYRTGIGGGLGDNQAYNFSIYDATWTRLRELSLSYSIQNAWTNKLKLNSIVLTATGRNLFLWDNIPGIDPEVNQVGVSNGFGLDYFTNPSTRSVLFSIQVNY